MFWRFGSVIAILATLFGAAAAHAQAGDEPIGVWLTQAGDARVRISKCGGGLCGGLAGRIGYAQGRGLHRRALRRRELDPRRAVSAGTVRHAGYLRWL